MKTIIGAEVAIARLDAFLTQQELADRIGKPKAWVVDVERGRTVPRTVEDVVALADALGAELPPLLGASAIGRNPLMIAAFHPRSERIALGERLAMALKSMPKDGGQG